MLPFVDMPPLQQERVICSVSAAHKYEIPAKILLAVAEKEGGKPGQWVKNTNGTHDVGSMQFNTAYLADLKKQYGITAKDAAASGCFAYELAAWRLRGHIKNDSGDIWKRAANYHSKTPKYNTPYRKDLIRKAAKWETWLIANLPSMTPKKEGNSTPEKQSNITYYQQTSSGSTGYTPRSITVYASQTATISLVDGNGQIINLELSRRD